ncbi:hypothetical protein Ciccas_010825 [Cichlidogyrus casuarinus]|uniref:Gag protein n=1 Tax=Cichlidogyrus casuarinus TaxID=1844966 RepID=A0ABD2PT18_9PLAT
MPGSSEELAELGIVRESGPVNNPAQESFTPPIITSPEKAEVVAAVTKPALPPPRFDGSDFPPDFYAVLRQQHHRAVSALNPPGVVSYPSDTPSDTALLETGEQFYVANIGVTLKELDAFTPLANVVRFEDLFKRPTAIQHAVYRLMKNAPPPVYGILANTIQQEEASWSTLKEAVGKTPEFGWPQQVMAVHATIDPPVNPSLAGPSNAKTRRAARRRLFVEKNANNSKNSPICRYHLKFGIDARLCAMNGYTFTR